MHRVGISEPSNLHRRRFLLAAAAGSAAATIAVAPARAATPAVPAAALDTAHASPELAAFMTEFFATKTARDVDGTMAFFSPELVTYIDAALGWDLAGYDTVKALFDQYMPTWPDTARSYPTRIVGDMEGGAFIAFTDTPELFGGELRILAALDFKDGKIVRWIDHWDSRGWPNTYGLEKTPLADYREAALIPAASAKLTAAAQSLFDAFAAGAIPDTATLFTDDVVLEDMTLRAQLIGRNAVHAYLTRALSALPYGEGASLRHVAGSDTGGAAEWTGAPTSPVKTGVTGLVLDGDGRIARLTTVYDGGLYDDAQIAAMSGTVLGL